MYKLFWVAADRQSDIDGGEFETEAQAEAAIPAWADQMIQCAGEKDQQRAIRAGSFVVVADDSRPGDCCSSWKWSDLDTLRQ